MINSNMDIYSKPMSAFSKATRNDTHIKSQNTENKHIFIVINKWDK